ncbi:MAG: MFS transporter [Pseudomonadota bacterium]
MERRGIWGWMLFDWANQPFYTLILTFIFAPYFADIVAPDAVTGQALWADFVLYGSLAVAFLAPVLGAIADQTGPRKPWIAVFSLMFVIGCSGLWWAEPGTGDLFWIGAAFLLAFVGSEFALIFVNAMLPDLAPRSETGRISGSGWAMGYAGGVAVLVVVLLLIAPAPGQEVTLLGLAPLFGLDPALGEPARATGPLTALWFVVFALPFFLYTRDAPRVARRPGVVGRGLRGLGRTLVDLPNHGDLLRFLVAALFYRDGLAALFAFGGIYASGVLAWQTFELGVFGIVAALTGAVGAWLGGRADKAFGPKPVVMTSIVVLIAVCIVTLSTSRSSVLFMPIADGSTLPDLVFYICGGLLGATAGSVQAASRTLLIHQAEGRIPMTEAFGLYALAGKATAFIGPLLIGLATRAFDSQQLGITPVVVLFLVGLILLAPVRSRDVEQEREAFP